MVMLYPRKLKNKLDQDKSLNWIRNDYLIQQYHPEEVLTPPFYMKRVNTNIELMMKCKASQQLPATMGAGGM
jgi:hypothetical protein